MHDIQKESLELHKRLQGKIALQTKHPIETRKDLSLLYSPGVAAASEAIAHDPAQSWELTSRRNWVAVVSNGTSVLGLGNIGAHAALPVMEGKAVLFKEFANIDAFPICLDETDPDQIIATVKRLAPNFGGINLEDIAAPDCFYIEEQLKNVLDIPVFHDDQHGTAIVASAALVNAARITSRSVEHMRIVINGAGAAGLAIARFLHSMHFKYILVVDSKGILSRDRSDLNAAKQDVLHFTNPDNINGALSDAIKGADAFIGVSVGNIVAQDMVRSMSPDPIILALANPVPEIMPEEAKAAGAAIVATGRSDYPNQVNNVLAFPGIFRGAIDAHAKAITENMKIAAVHALINAVENPTPGKIIPDVLDRSVTERVAEAVRNAA